MIILRFIHVIASIVCCGYLLASMNSVISMNGSYTHSAMHVEKYVRTLVIKMSLRMLSANYDENSVIPVYGSYTHSAMHVENSFCFFN